MTNISNAARTVSNLRIDGGLLAHAAFLLDGVPHTASVRNSGAVEVRNSRTGSVVAFVTDEIAKVAHEAKAFARSLNAELAESPDVVRGLVVVLPGVTDAG